MLGPDRGFTTLYPASLGVTGIVLLIAFAVVENRTYIFVYQDVRGRYMSEGTRTDMRPFIPDSIKVRSSTRRIFTGHLRCTRRCAGTIPTTFNCNRIFRMRVR
ncbi:MAG TPA: hypothetical protein VII66_02850 [Gemmatimonadaceae bacterium]